MTQTDNMAAADTQQDLAKLKLPELRKMASGMGLKGISGLRKGELITAIKTGSVPARAAKEQAPAQKAQDPAENASQARSQTDAADAKQDKQEVLSVLDSLIDAVRQEGFEKGYRLGYSHGKDGLPDEDEEDELDADEEGWV